MQEKLKKLKNNSLLEVSHWWGLFESGHSGTIITQDKKLYTYTFYHRLTPFLEDNNIPLEYISKGKQLTKIEYQQIINFIEKEIIGKKFKCMCIRDAGYSVRGTYKGKEFNISNNIDYGEEKGLYNKASELIKSLKGGN